MTIARRPPFRRPGFVASMLCFATVPAAFGGAELSVVSVEPARHSIGAAPGAAITVRFDRAVMTSSVDASSFWAFARWSGAVSGTYAFTEGGQAVTLTPSRPFSAGEQVMVILSRDLMGDDGSSLRSSGYSFQFWVRAAPAGLDLEQIDVLSTDSPSRPYGGFASDVNGDGFLDITTVNEDTSDLRVFLNRADGSGLFDDFLQPTAATGSVPSPSEPSDFNRDGHVDVALANTGSTTASILLGNGDGTFGALQEVPVGGLPRGLAVLDVDGDGDVDIATANRTSSQLTVLRNDGTGVFGNATSFGTGTAGEWALAAGDMNDDGLLDLVAGGFDSQRIYVYTSNGDGTFTLSDDVAGGGSSWMLVLGDVNGDGQEDVSVANSNTVGAIHFGDGTGQLGPAQPYAIDSLGLATDLGDLDGDGDLDWIVASFSGDWRLFLNDSTGSFTFDREFDAPAAASCSLMMDSDNDGDLDLALIDEIADQILVVRNQGAIFTDGFESGDVTRWSSVSP